MPLLAYSVPTVKAAYVYTFVGVNDETTGLFTENTTVTAYFSGGASEDFWCNTTATQSFSSQPTFFVYELGDVDREYWVEASDNATTLYIANDTLSQYTVFFNDLAGKLDVYPYVELKADINGTSRTVEKRRVDVENKIYVGAVDGEKYDVTIGSYTYGELLFTSDASVELNVLGLEFPETVIVGYRYVKVYADRDMASGVINAYYNDSLSATSSVDIYIYYQANDTLAYATSYANSSFTFTWGGADNETDYYINMLAEHSTFGALSYSQVLPRTFSYDTPFSLSFLGESLPFDTSYLIPAFMVLAVAGCFSAANTAVGLFATIAVAIIVAYLGWLPLSVDLLVFVFALMIIFGLVVLRRR